MKEISFGPEGIPDETEMNRRIDICSECEFKTCAFNSEGVICVFPIFYGRKADVSDNGCKDFIYDEKGAR